MPQFSVCLYCEKTDCAVHNFQEIAQSVISYWRKEELRGEVKALKKKMDELDKAKKAAVMTEVRDVQIRHRKSNVHRSWTLISYDAVSYAEKVISFES